MRQLTWYLKRLSVMGPREVAHRIGEQGWLAYLRWRQSVSAGSNCSNIDPQSTLSFCSAALPQLPTLPWSFDPDEAQVAELLNGEAAALGFAWRWHDDAEVWHRAPDTGKAWPQRFFAAVPYRAGNPYGDVRVVWEPSRLQHLIALALLAQSTTADESDRAAALLEAQLQSWTAGNPPYLGVHYISAMECALRLVAVCHAVDLVRTQLSNPDATWKAVAGLVRSHAPFVERRLSLYSSAGNHTVAECVGLIYAGVLFPELAEASVWVSRGSSVLCREASRQVLADGGGIEQSFSYHCFVLQLIELAVRLLRARDHACPRDLSDALERGWSFLDAVSVADGQAPPVGDGDGGYALSPHLRRRRPGSATRSEMHSFESAGYSVIRTDSGQSSMLLFDHGPLGMLPACGHGHADALSVVLYLDEQPILLDPGTFTYTGDARWRGYFRGTPAHNTITVDGEDQALQETAFQWGRGYRCSMVRQQRDADGTVRILARHDGYARFGVVHWRAVTCWPGQYILVWDMLRDTVDAASTPRTFDLHWHSSGPIQDNGTIGTGPGGPVVHLHTEGGDVEAFRGEMNPVAGWRAPVYGTKESITTLRTRYCGPLPHEFKSLIGLTSPGSVDGLVDEAVELMRQWVRDAETD